MANQVTVLTKDGQSKVVARAWKNNFLFYRSIGTEATVFHREQTKNIWGNTSTDWVKHSASLISITNTYRGSGPGTGTRSKACPNASYCELKEWAVGLTLTIPVDSPTDVGGGAILDIDSVAGHVTVQIGEELLTADVSASSAFSDISIW